MTSTTKIPPWFSVAGAAEPLLVAAAQSWENTSLSEQYVQQALDQPNVDLNVLVSAYRYHFYKNNNAQALAIATTVCDRIQASKQWPTPWENLCPLLQTRLEDDIVRLYLSAYVASGLLLARLGHTDKAQEIANQVQQLEAREFGSELLLKILNTPLEDEEY